MPRSRLPRLASINDGSFEPSRRNPLSLRNDEPLDSNLKQIKVGEGTSPLELSKDELRINGDLFLNGNLKSHRIETDNEYLDLVPNRYTRFQSQFYTGKLDLYATTKGAGAIYMHSDVKDWYFIGEGSGRGVINFGSITGGTTYLSQIKFSLDIGRYYFGAPESDNEWFEIEVDADGVTVLKTVDAGGTTAGHLTIQPQGDLILDPASQKTAINATDGLYFDGGGDTYIYESAADTLRINVGGDTLMQLSEKGDDGNEIHFGSTCVGFTQLEPTYDATDTLVDFRNSNKQNLTFGSGSITNLNLYFPTASGNFQLLIKQDGTGSRTITNYKVREFDESLADGESSVKFAGGSNPTLTTDANHVDILSFYWDADNEIAYGVATLDFQF